DDLEEAIELHRAALELCPEGHPDRSMSLINFATSLSTRYDKYGRTEDLEEAIELHRVALELLPEGHRNRSLSLNNLASSLCTRYFKRGMAEDLEEAIEFHRAALELRPEGHPNRSASLNNLASSLSTRYDRHGRTEDLEGAIELHRAALNLQSEGYPYRPTSLYSLANSLSTRNFQHGRSEDLEEAIELYRAAVELSHKGHPDHYMSLGNLAISLSTRYNQHASTDDLAEAIDLQRAVLELIPKGHPNISTSLNNLANSLRMRYDRHERAEDLEEAIKLDRAALELRPKGHPNRSTSLNNLANSLSTRYNQYGMTEDLEEAIELYRAAFELHPDGHPDRSGSLLNLSESLLAQVKNRWCMEQFEECMCLLELAATHKFSSSMDRLDAARRWATLARSHNHHTAFTAYKTTISIFQHALTIDPTLNAQHDFLLRNSDHRVLSLDAASYSVEKNRLEQAVEILEQGRGLLWSQLRGLRPPLDQLIETNEELVERFRNVNSELRRKSFDALLRSKRQLSREQEEVINEIRRVPGFENFLEATPFRALQQAASEGPVIMVNHCKYRSDALIIVSRDDLSVTVPSLRIARRSAMSFWNLVNNLRGAMKMLWDRVVSKVIDKLTEVGIAKGSRIWWCPTSVLSALPFHAAGPYRDTDGTTKYLLDDYISSYTPTLGALINSRSNCNSSEPKLLIIGDTKTLKSTRQEIRNVWNSTGDSILERTILLDKKASRRTVLEGLQKATWIHFACHGHLGSRPFDSSFKLADGGLTLLDIIQANVPNAEFAFLSACHTAELSHSGAHDEALHLSAAMQFSGFRSVIGTMWEMYDDDGPCVAKAVYGYMNEYEDDKARFKRAAGGLRKAALELRAKDWIPAERWVNFVHIGA
ncbi:TPR-like protein, partial [Fomitiporia mediterranea MF3/22]